MRNFSLSAIILLLLSYSVKGQVSTLMSGILNTSGGSAIISDNFTFDWNFGESESTETYFLNNPFPNSTFGSNWNLTSGFLQPSDRGKIIYIYPVLPWAKDEVTIYPNPTPNKIFIKFKLITAGNLGKINVQLIGRDGKTLGEKQFQQVLGISTEMWDLSAYPGGVYFFRIILKAPEGNIVKSGSFKIIKI
jgi:hypothetical protein